MMLALRCALNGIDKCALGFVRGPELALVSSQVRKLLQLLGRTKTKVNCLLLKLSSPKFAVCYCHLNFLTIFSKMGLELALVKVHKESCVVNLLSTSVLMFFLL